MCLSCQGHTAQRCVSWWNVAGGAGQLYVVNVLWWSMMYCGCRKPRHSDMSNLIFKTCSLFWCVHYAFTILSRVVSRVNCHPLQVVQRVRSQSEFGRRPPPAWNQMRCAAAGPRGSDERSWGTGAWSRWSWKAMRMCPPKWLLHMVAGVVEKSHILTKMKQMKSIIWNPLWIHWLDVELWLPSLRCSWSMSPCGHPVSWQHMASGCEARRVGISPSQMVWTSLQKACKAAPVSKDVHGWIIMDSPRWAYVYIYIYGKNIYGTPGNVFIG